jgi:phosphocarrier protein
MIETTTTIINKLGLHARASAKLTKLASSFTVRCLADRRENAASMPKASWA